MTGPQVFRVALDMPLRRLFDYLAPEAGPSADQRTVNPTVGAIVGTARAPSTATAPGIAMAPDAAVLPGFTFTKR